MFNYILNNLDFVNANN